MEKLEDLEAPDVRKEQYSTAPSVAAEMLHFAHMNGDLEGVVYDLGCGNGILSIGAKLLGARKVVGVDKDERAIKLAIKNSRRIGVDVEFINCDIREIGNPSADTVVMNPPFGAQRSNRGMDRIFIETALRIADVVYSIHNAGSENFIRKFIYPNVITHRMRTYFPLKRRFPFHKKDVKLIEVDIYRMERRQ